MSDLLTRLPRVTTAIKDGIARGQHFGALVSISLGGEVIVDEAMGLSYDDIPLTTDTLLPWLSAGKPFTAVAILRLIESGRLHLETPVADVIPQFAMTDAPVTVRHLLNHTAGLRKVVTGWPDESWDVSVSRIAEAGVTDDWIPGERAAYDPQRSWFLLGEIVRQIDGRSIETVVHDDIMRPLGMRDSWMAMSAARHIEYGDRIGRTYMINRGETEPTLTKAHAIEWAEAPSPGASCRGPVRELRLFYEMLHGGGVASDGTPILKPETVALMTQRHRVGLFDETFQHTLDFGLGLIVNSNRYGARTVPYGYGPHASEEAYGHGGSRSSIAFVDPTHGLVACIVANGCPPDLQHQRRFRGILSALYEDLELADPIGD